MKKILVVEDDPKIRELIVEFLKCQDYKIDSAKDGIEGYSKFKEEEYDLIILDVMMPKLDGYGLCNLIREESDIPIIFLTALNEDEDQIKAFDAMADDAMKSGNIAVNPRSTTKKDVLSLYEKAL